MPKILVADDNANIQKMVSLALEERGISVVSVGNGEAAVRRIPDLDPDLVLADIFMPVRNGYEVCEFVKKDERFAHVPVILLVGAFDPLDEKEARRVGADGVLKKPFVPPDPLIAMVTSALEKNPRVAAELAKAKQAKMAPPEPEPISIIDLSTRSESKPLPEFPEPSPEEAALVYGFGKGVRPQEAIEEADDEGGVKGPVAVPNSRSTDDEEDEAQSASSDWRRSAMDLEIPADMAGQPAMASMDDLEPMNFPSEKDYPPRHVSVSEAVADTKREVAKGTAGSSGFSLRQVEDTKPEIAAEGALSSSGLPGELELKAEVEPEPPVGVHAAAGYEAPPDDLPEPNSTSAGGHWLDAVSTAQPGHPQGGWMEGLTSPATPPHSGPAAEPEADALSSDTVTESAEMSAASQSSAISEISFSHADSGHEERQSDQSDQSEDQSFFADDSDRDSTAAPDPEQQNALESFASGPTAAGRDIELDTDDSEPPLAFKDPALVEPPAVHVTPEPLLVEEEENAPSQYGAAPEAMTPLHTLFAPGEETASATLASVPSASAAEFSIQSASESSGNEISERIPTMPPPNREALSHIPFLTPPPAFLADMNSAAPPQQVRAADPETVDTVVQKVLEKLQPQLQELLSQGLLKPLVENLLQNELTKKR